MNTIYKFKCYIVRDYTLKLNWLIYYSSFGLDSGGSTKLLNCNIDGAGTWNINLQLTCDVDIIY